MKLNVQPRTRRSWECIIGGEAGAWVASTTPAEPAHLCGLLPNVDDTIAMDPGTPANVLRVQAY